MPIIFNIVIDEMAIRTQISFMNEKFYGCVDLGTGSNIDNIKEATNALVFLAVSINGYWIVPLGYFFVLPVFVVVKEQTYWQYV